MGICASCLGLRRRSSQDETDPLLDDDQHESYGGLGGDTSQPDEEEIQREREHLEQITATATDSMIDVLHPRDVVHLAKSGSQRSTPRNGTPDLDEEEEEAAWLQSVQAAGGGGEDAPIIKGLQTGSLVMDMSQLRKETPTSTPKKGLRGKLPAF